jgi:negative regulator of flagellin synthesis FlgM
MTISIVGSNATQSTTDKRSNGTDAAAPTAIGSGIAQQPTPPVSADTVHISTQAVDLRGLEAHISQLPDVDKVRITELRNQIANGQYQINDQSVAERILKFETEL